MPREFEERNILFAHVVENADRGVLVVRQPHDIAARAAELPLQRLHPGRRRVEVLLKKLFENGHEYGNSTHRCYSIENTAFRVAVACPAESVASSSTT